MAKLRYPSITNKITILKKKLYSLIFLTPSIATFKAINRESHVIRRAR